MGTDTDTETSNPEIQPRAQFDPAKKPAPGLDEIDVQGESDETDVGDDQDAETEIHLDQMDEKSGAQSAPDDSQALNSDEKSVTVEAIPSDSHSDEGDASGKDTAAPDGEAPSAKDPRDPDSEPGEIPLDDDDIEDGAAVESQPKVKADDGEQKQKTGGEDRADDEAAGIVKKAEALPKRTKPTPTAKKPAANAWASKKIVLPAFIMLMVAGAVIYSQPDLFGLKGQLEEAGPGKPKIEAPPKQAQIQTPQPQPPGKNDRYRAKLEEASRLREELLAKREEIYRLKLHYRNGIAELMDQIYRELQVAPVASYDEALQNKRIELNLRTIQRRQNYIQELEKPDQWAHRGSEELLFLKRKTLIDLEMADIAGGVDLARHMRDINAAVQKYQPSADTLAVDPPPAKQTPLETIWRQIRDQQSGHLQAPVGEKNENIIAAICSGDFTRMAELTAITPQAAECLARMDGSELFLNGLTQLTAREAEFLFKWKGNWICLNGVKNFPRQWPDIYLTGRGIGSLSTV